MRRDIRDQIHDYLSEIAECWSKMDQAGTFNQHRFMRLEDRIFSLIETVEEEIEMTVEEQRDSAYDEAKDDAYAEAYEDVHAEIKEDISQWLEAQKSKRSFQKSKLT